MSEFDGGFSLDANGGFSVERNSQRQAGARQSLTPVTIKQLNDADQPIPDGEFRIHNVNLSMISFVGIVRKVVPLANLIVITIEDGTGSVEVRKWIDDQKMSAAEEVERFEAYLSKYVYVGGALKMFQEKKSVQNATVTLIEDHNQVLYHNLSAIANHLKAQGIVPSKSEKLLFVSADDKGPKAEIERVFDIYKKHSPSMPEGVPISFVAQALDISPSVVMEYSRELSETGRVYLGTEDTCFIAIDV
ncbi:replication protein A, subunit RPA32 [Suhomyces tanzawaensis NRRL Y-17324]|uniref:Replication protein A, subunit RPA32 n=1 Tax=Suhomyces tanzawaensis NRRL Y-17324 TaxID=984487 RepID=A0A1E4SL12_9ASCO|nr:replication protein A, subunit RPA32 [Suhomyces tanzawaensis NRRL Y-17324]ODV80178.1 replication protein A, subunit RPA32 [Suhomyces tanzawaensis NRRL Y-17324]